ncbi:hypothetical protein [Bradyrhizobium sp. DASA03120]|uniref:hypothetical protein n=1 Tax=Bradyrhizobium sp. SMVTL-02 TaxID=3395917 RepID=UPI003F716616
MAPFPRNYFPCAIYAQMCGYLKLKSDKRLTVSRCTLVSFGNFLRDAKAVRAVNGPIAPGSRGRDDGWVTFALKNEGLDLAILNRLVLDVTEDEIAGLCG